MSPMMQQYFEIKEQYKDHLLFYRLGDFYEMFFDDAKIAAKELDLVLTARDSGDGERAPMCGVPFHACDGYIAKLIEKGYKVAICEQMVDPATCKGIVPRDVIRVITPGTVTLGGALDEEKNNYLVSIFVDGSAAALAFYDLSRPEVEAISLSAEDRERLWQEIVNECAKFDPSEAVINLPAEECVPLKQYLEKKPGSVVNCGMYDLFDGKNRALIARQFGKSEAELGFAPGDKALPLAVAALVAYLDLTQKTALRGLAGIRVYDSDRYLDIDANSRRNLELTETLRTREKKGTLLWVLDKTNTAAGARLMRRFLEQPLTNSRAIAKRQSGVLEFFNGLSLREETRKALSDVQDVDRILTRILYGTGSARDLYALGQTLSHLPRLAEILAPAVGEALEEICRRLREEVLPETKPLSELLLSAVKPDAPVSVREGGFIAPGYDRELDELNSIMTESRKYLASVEATEQELTGIPKLKIGYNRVFGYYFEVSKGQTHLVPDRYIRKQTLVNAERYITSELKDLESRILGARDRAVALEYELFTALCDKVKACVPILQTASHLVALTDVYAALAEVAARNNYTCPVVDYSDAIYIRDGRHPVVETVSTGFFVPNDADLNTVDKRMAIITGPNMAGKSTYMRQVALIVIMAQIGSFVPAKEARIGIVDKIFTRVGASDDLATGQSTFMLEMSEVAYILKNATKKSLIIYDEIGRGTSTYDGMSIARAVVERVLTDSLFVPNDTYLDGRQERVAVITGPNMAGKSTYMRQVALIVLM
ncbi:MAG: DNA mismatch repair protein MutS, partial [Clostridia bacterium]|nr:DNA mismatch repair protein MutS [Clostridia bacterium]